MRCCDSCEYETLVINSVRISVTMTMFGDGEIPLFNNSCFRRRI